MVHEDHAQPPSVMLYTARTKPASQASKELFERTGEFPYEKIVFLCATDDIALKAINIEGKTDIVANDLSRFWLQKVNVERPLQRVIRGISRVNIDLRTRKCRQIIKDLPLGILYRLDTRSIYGADIHAALI